MQRNRSSDNLPRIDDKHPVGLIGNVVERAQILEYFGHRLMLAHRDHVLRHELADRVFCVVSRVGQPRSVTWLEASRDFIEHVLWHFVGEEGEIVSVERAECRDELVSRKFIDERGSSRFARLDEGGAGLLQFELTENDKAIVGGQRVENRRDVSRVLEPDVALQLHQILAVLHLLEQVVARCLLPAGERRQDAMTLQQARDFVAGFATVCSGDHGRVDRTPAVDAIASRAAATPENCHCRYIVFTAFTAPAFDNPPTRCPASPPAMRVRYGGCR